MKKFLFFSLLLMGSNNLFGYRITNMSQSQYPIKVQVFKSKPFLESRIGRLAEYDLKPGQSSAWNYKEIQKKYKNIKNLYFIVEVFTSKGIETDYVTLFKDKGPIDKGIQVLNAKNKAGKIIGGAYYQDQTGKVFYINNDGYQKAKKALGI